MNGELALHIVEVMESFHTSGRTARRVEMKSRPKQPEPLPKGLPLGQLR